MSAHSVKLPADVAEASKIRAERLDYPSWNAYILGLIRADIINLPSHELPKKIAGMGPRNRDRIDAEILERAVGATMPAPAIPSEDAEADNVVQMLRPADPPRAASGR